MCPFSRRRLGGGGGGATEQPPSQFGETVNTLPLEVLQGLVEGREARFALPQHLSSSSSEEFTVPSKEADVPGTEGHRGGQNSLLSVLY